MLQLKTPCPKPWQGLGPSAWALEGACALGRMDPTSPPFPFPVSHGSCTQNDFPCCRCSRSSELLASRALQPMWCCLAGGGQGDVSWFPGMSCLGVGREWGLKIQLEEKWSLSPPILPIHLSPALQNHSCLSTQVFASRPSPWSWAMKRTKEAKSNQQNWDPPLLPLMMALKERK